MVVPDTPAAVEQWRIQAHKELNDFVYPNEDWQCALNNYISSHYFQNSGFLQKSQSLRRQYGGHVPSGAALTVLQTRARELIRRAATSDVAAEHTAFDEQMALDVVMTMRLYNAHSSLPEVYTMTIRLNDESLPANSAHFRTAARNTCLGSCLHTCFIPPQHGTNPTLPFVTFYGEDGESTCATTPLVLPDSDIVYGEYSQPAPVGTSSRATLYPVGTVLYFPYTVYSHYQRDQVNPHTMPWFIVFTPCPTDLLRGAVPVGRVMSCVAGDEPALYDSSDEPFDVTVLKHLVTRSHVENCCNGNRVAKVCVYFRKYVAKDVTQV